MRRRVNAVVFVAFLACVIGACGGSFLEDNEDAAADDGGADAISDSSSPENDSAPRTDATIDSGSDAQTEADGDLDEASVDAGDTCHTLDGGARPDASADGGLLFPFQQVATIPASARGLAIGDVTGDGRNDIVVSSLIGTDTSATIFVFAQNPCGGLEPPVTYVAGEGFVGIGDVTGDGRQDVVVEGLDSLVVLPQKSDGTLGLAASYSMVENPGFIAIGDFNGDGRNDVFTYRDQGFFFFQTPAGGLTGPVHYQVDFTNVHDMGQGDLNHDGREDVVVMRGGLNESLDVLLQRVDGGFDDPAAYNGADGSFSNLGHTIAVGDFNGDGRDDVAMSYSSAQQLGFFRQNVSGTLDLPLIIYNDNDKRLRAADINGDGLVDLVQAYNEVGVRLQQDGGSFADPEIYASGPNGELLAVGDINSDGKPDVVWLPTFGWLLVGYNAR